MSRDMVFFFRRNDYASLLERSVRGEVGSDVFQLCRNLHAVALSLYLEKRILRCSLSVTDNGNFLFISGTRNEKEKEKYFYSATKGTDPQTHSALCLTRQNATAHPHDETYFLCRKRPQNNATIEREASSHSSGSLHPTPCVSRFGNCSSIAYFIYASNDDSKCLVAFDKRRRKTSAV